MHVPISTYRLQITADFDLFAASRRLAYLHDLGVDWVYLSPILAAEPGSSHGYDVVDHAHVDASRGGAEGLAALSAEARRLGLGVLVDIVPNHVGVATPTASVWWWDVLKHGRTSVHAHAFDIEWTAGDGRIQLPVVGTDDLLPDGRIAHLALAEQSPAPVEPSPAPVERSRDQSPASVERSRDHPPASVEPTKASVEQSPASVEPTKASVERSRDHTPEVVLTYHDHTFPIAPGTLRPGDDADTVHARQHYALVDWRNGDDALNYRRFFTVSTLAGIRVEDHDVFADSHVEIKRWFDAGLVDGLRVDHPDGLRDPERYLRDLADLTDGAYVLVEKILEAEEELPSSWATAGTTGYDALGRIDRVLTDPAGESPLQELETRLRGHATDWAALIHDTKRAAADVSLAAEVNRLTREVEALVENPDASVEHPDASVEHPDASVEHPDASVERSRDPLPDAIAELLACFPVYRSYLPRGREDLDEAFALARGHRPDLATSFDLLEPIMADPHNDPALRFQQTSGMVMAKGVEDCAFYRYARLTSLNEVGGDPSEFALAPAGFHAYAAHRQQTWPAAMTCLSTHDTKRGEDVRARITVLAELPDLWASALDRLLGAAPLPDPGFGNLLWQAVVGVWPAGSGLDSARPTRGDARPGQEGARPTQRAGRAASAASDQSRPPREGDGLDSARPTQGDARPTQEDARPEQGDARAEQEGDLRARLHGYAEKAMREAGDRTTWTEPDTAYEEAVHAAVDAALDDPEVRAILHEVVAAVVAPGWSNGLAAKLLALTMPGVPDVYQGSELWEQSLVDPDNRRPVDLDLRASLLAGDDHALTDAVDDDGRAKLALTASALRLRRDRPELFDGYTPLLAEGAAADHALAFDRGGAITVVTRLPVGLAARGGWGQTVLRLPEGSYADQVTGATHSGDVLLADLLAELPVALLARRD